MLNQKLVKYKHYLPFVAFVLILMLLFNFTKVSVVEKESKFPVSYAKVNFFVTNEEGNASFLDTNFTKKVKVTRIGFKDYFEEIPFSLFVRNIRNIMLERASYNEIFQQITDFAYSLDVYAYHMKSESKDGILEIIAKKNGKLFSFVFSNKSQDSEETYAVYNINTGMYIKENNMLLKGPLTEEEQNEFYNKNIPFIELQDVLSEVFSINDGDVEYRKNGNLLINGKNANLEIYLGTDGNPSKIVYSEKNIESPQTVTLEIQTKGVSVTLNED